MRSELAEIRDQQRQTWDKFSSGWKKWDKLVLDWLDPVGQELVRSAALGEDANVLDVAAGTGEPGLTAAALIPKGMVTVTDLSEKMLEVAAENAARRGLKNFQTRQCDAGALPFPDDSFDAVLCRFGFMFFPDLDVSVKEFARVTRPGGRVCAAVWNAPEKNPWTTTVTGTINKYVDMPTPPPWIARIVPVCGTGIYGDSLSQRRSERHRGEARRRRTSVQLGSRILEFHD